jgi:hypothetical protein
MPSDEVRVHAAQAGGQWPVHCLLALKVRWHRTQSLSLTAATLLIGLITQKGRPYDWK